MCTPGLCKCGRCGTSGFGDQQAALLRAAERTRKEIARQAERAKPAALPKTP